MRLSILDAAADAPDQPALVTRDRSWTYGELAERVEAETASVRGEAAILPLVATNDADTVVRIWACLEAKVPVALLHPRLTASERAALTAELRHPAGAVVFFTSGTTGRSKGAVLSERALIASARASEQNLGWAPDDRWLLAMPIAHVGGFSILVRCALARKTVLLEPRFDPERLQRRIVEERATVVSLVPTMLGRLLDRGFDPGHLRVILLGGAAPSPALLSRAAHLPVRQTYGLTEAASQVTLDGRPLPGIDVRIRQGRIQVRGPTLFSGYLGGPPHEGWFDTRDLGAFDEDGRLLVLGRTEELIVSGGENVYPAEVEATLKRCDAVAEACVFGVPDLGWGEVVAAALVPRGAPATSELGRVLRSELAGHKRPRLVCWVDELATNRSGKIDRRAVRARTMSLLCPL